MRLVLSLNVNYLLFFVNLIGDAIEAIYNFKVN